MREVDLKLTDQELDIVLRSMAEQPYKIVSGLISKIINQANAQPEAEPQPAFVPVQTPEVPTP